MDVLKRGVSQTVIVGDSPPVADPLWAGCGVIGKGGRGWWRGVRRWWTHWSHLLPGCWDKELLPPAGPGLQQGQNRKIRDVMRSSIDPHSYDLHQLPQN